MIEKKIQWFDKIKDFQFTKEDIKNLKYNLKLKTDRYLAMNVHSNTIRFCKFDDDVKPEEFVVLILNEHLKNSSNMNIDELVKTFHHSLNEKIKAYCQNLLSSYFIIQNLKTVFPLTKEIITPKLLRENYTDLILNVQGPSYFWHQNKINETIIKLFLEKYTVNDLLSDITSDKNKLKYIFDVFQKHDAIDEFLTSYDNIDSENMDAYSYKLQNDQLFLKKSINNLYGLTENKISFEHLILLPYLIDEKDKGLLQKYCITQINITHKTVQYVNQNYTFNFNTNYRPVRMLDIFNELIDVPHQYSKNMDPIKIEVKDIDHQELILFKKNVQFIFDWLTLQRKYNRVLTTYNVNQNVALLHSESYYTFIKRLLSILNEKG